MLSAKKRSTAWILYLLTIASAAPLAWAMAVSNPMPEGACSGIGWGCSLYGWDAAGFFLMIFGIPFAVLLALILAALSFLPDRFVWIATTVASIGLAVPWVLLLGGLVTT